MAKIEWKTQEEIEQEKKNREEAEKLPADKEKIQILEKENDDLRQEVQDTKRRTIATEEALLDLATMVISL